MCQSTHLGGPTHAAIPSAVTLTVSIAASLIFSLAFLPAALCVLGPDGDTGSILPVLDAAGLGFLIPDRDGVRS